MHSALGTLLFCLAAVFQTPPAIFVDGLVLDPTGAPIAGAAIRFERSAEPPIELRASDDGRFEIAAPASTSTRLVVSAPGFAPRTEVLSAPRRGLQVVLEPAPFFEAVNVTSSRTDVPRADPTVTMTVISSADLAAQAALTLDDALKLIPGFTLFRRSSSRVSNPTAQGMTLRGLGGTGSSRSLVLADGVPLNDAFGGWIYWDKLPQAAVERVEILRGSGSDLYGADAVGGVIQILTSHPDRLSGRGMFEHGSLGTSRVSLFGGASPGHTSVTAGGEWFETDGYIPVAPSQRGPIDNRAGSTHRSVVASIGHEASNGWRFETGGTVFSESRLNGTPAVVNSTSSRMASGRLSGGGRGGLLSFRAYGGTQGYDQTFSSVPLTRASEELIRRQRIPTKVFGAGGQWLRAIGRHGLLIGAEDRVISGRTQETQLSQGRVVGVTDDGGMQQVGSVFVQDTVLLSDRLTVVGGAHADGWHTRSDRTGYNKTLGSFSPRASISYRVADRVSVRGSAYRGFRAPTLNELYRGFRSGNTQTNPNEALQPERLRGADAGLLISRRRVSIRGTVFWNVLDDVISNVTRSRTPTLITQQRQNADRLRSAGVELEAEARPWPAFSIALSGAIVNARFQGATLLEGHRVPQVPQHNIGVNAQFARRGWTATSQYRVTGRQFEDDLNLLVLRPAHVVDAMAARQVTDKARVFAAVENLFDAAYDVARTPTLSLGLPRAVRAGLHLTWR